MVLEDCIKVGIRMQRKQNTKGPMKTKEATELERKEDLGSWIDSAEKDIKLRTAQAWRALNKMRNMWESRMSWNHRVHLAVQMRKAGQ